MIKLIRRDGGEMWVHESRLDEYLARGNKLAPPPEPAKKPTPKKKTTTK